MWVVDTLMRSSASSVAADCWVQTDPRLRHGTSTKQIYRNKTYRPTISYNIFFFKNNGIVYVPNAARAIGPLHVTSVTHGIYSQ